MAKTLRSDHKGPQRTAYLKAKNRLLKTCDVCALCGKPIDKTKKFPDPMSPTIDHIIPVSRGGHPSDINNLQLTHWKCNRAKSTKIQIEQRKKENDETIIDNRNLPWSCNWLEYRSEDSDK